MTLTIGSSPGIIIADTITNYGNIVSGWTLGSGGSGGADGTGSGGAGAGGIIIIARSLYLGTVIADGYDGDSGGLTDLVGANGRDGIECE